MRNKLLERYRYSLILLRELVVTEFKLRYQGSVLGYLWSLLRPMFLFIILYVVFVYFLRIGEGIEHWPVAMLLGIVVWNYFSEVTNIGVRSIVDRGDMIRKINFPKYIIVISSSVSAFINLLINLAVVAIFMVFSGVEPSWLLLLAPLFIIQLFVLSLGLAFLLSAIFVKFRDINYIWEIIMQGLFYASIVIYPAQLVIDISPQAAQLLMLNPIAQIIQDLRHTVISTEMPNLFMISQSLLISVVPVVITVVVFVVGAAYFKKRSPYFAEEV
jgi:ABC-2 type transport system permease protein